MRRTLEVADAYSNREEHIERASLVLGRSNPRKDVFLAIYHHKKKVKSVDEICLATRMKRMRVLQEANFLAKHQLINSYRKDGSLFYEKIDFYDVHKKQIIRAASDPAKRAKIPTKRRMVVSVKQTSSGSREFSSEFLAIDDIRSFAKVKATRRASSISPSISEDQFKNGIQRIIGQRGVFKDWGGEPSDLFTTRLTIGNRRVAAAFAFKGPGLKSKLYVANMGKRGDQALRLFKEPADAFFVQHWREIDSAVVELLQNLATAKAQGRRKKIYFGVIDGVDSARIVRAYPNAFKK